MTQKQIEALIRNIKKEDIDLGLTEYKKIHNIYEGYFEPYIQESDLDLYKVNYFWKIINKYRDIILQTEPTREVMTSSPAIKLGAEIVIFPTISKIMPEIVVAIEKFNKIYFDYSDQKIYTPLDIYVGEHEDNEFFLKFEETEDGKKVFNWIIYDSYKYVISNGKKIISAEKIENFRIYSKKEDLKRSEFLAHQQLEYTKMATFNKYGNLSGALNPVFTDDPELKNIQFGVGAVNLKSKNSEVEKLHLNNNLKNPLDEEIRMEENLFAIAGIPKAAIVGDVTARSASELIIKWWPIVETANKLKKEYSRIEKEIFADMLDIAISGNKNYELVIKYDDNALPSIAQEKEDVQFKLDNNIINIYDLIKQENPTATDKEVEEIFINNKILNQKLKGGSNDKTE